MADLYLGLALIAVLSVSLFAATSLLARRLTSLQRNLLAAAVVAGMVLYTRLLWQNTLLAEWLPLSNLIVLGNWFPLFLAALGGVVRETTSIAAPRKTVSIALLAGLACYASLSPLLGRAPQCSQQLSPNGNCLQTTQFTCSAASAATLLQAHGMAASEQEMAELCLTRRGTNWLGLYRGLKLKTQGTKWDVEVVRCSADEVPRYAATPMVIDVGLEAGESVDSAFRSESGWAPGMRHSVVLTGYSGHHASIIDPSPHIGHEDWDDATFKLLWRGYGLRLVERER
jgi:hypothetical protein